MLDRAAAVVLSSALLCACTGRDAIEGDTSAGDDTSGDDADDGDTTGDPEGGSDTSSPPGPGSASGDGSEGDDPVACDGNAPTCFFDEPGTCAHVVDELPALCEGREWTCPAGYAFESDLQCTPEGEELCTEGERCWVGGDCGAESYEPTCISGAPTCDPGDALECAWLCEPGDVPPSDCYDQGPGECADYAPPPNCDDGVWTCPNGFDFGGYGEGCEFPGG